MEVPIASHPDRRGSPRIAVARRAFMQADGTDVAFTGTILDLHDRGAFLAVFPEQAKVHPIGTRLQVIFRVPNDKDYLHLLALCTVRWVGFSQTHGQMGLGVAFEEPMPSVLSYLVPVG